MRWQLPTALLERPYAGDTMEVVSGLGYTETQALYVPQLDARIFSN